LAGARTHFTRQLYKRRLHQQQSAVLFCWLRCTRRRTEEAKEKKREKEASFVKVCHPQSLRSESASYSPATKNSLAFNSLLSK